MARQSTKPVMFNRSTRVDNFSVMTSGRAGKVYPLTYIPLLRGDSASGQVSISLELAEMPRPLQNGVMANFQAWFVPKNAHPKFVGMEEFNHSYLGEDIKSMAGDRTPPPFFDVISGADVTEAEASEFFRALGIHVPAGASIQADLVDAFWLVYNFRLASYSSALPRAKYVSEDLTEALTLPRAFWPAGRRSRMVPDYERALIVGNLDLDVVAGQIDVNEIYRYGSGDSTTGNASYSRNSTATTLGDNVLGSGITFDILAGEVLQVSLAGSRIGTTLADIDKARETQAFAKMRTAYAGNDTTGFDNDNVITAHLMQGFNIPAEQFKRPWLLDSSRVPFGFAERHATDGANLEKSVSQGVASTQLSLNVPVQDGGGVIIVTCEVLPEALDERMTDEWLHITQTSQFPDALRDSLRTEPVDMVLSRRIDAKHTSPNSQYGFEPMNDVWNRSGVRLGGDYYQATPGEAWTEQRSAIWQAEIIDPEFTSDHYLAPAPFPHYVFSDTTADAFEAVVRHNVAIVGLTQIGDVLHENNDDYEAITGSEE